MVRKLIPALMLAAMSAAPALAQAAPPEADDNHFQFHKVEDGFVRLDLRTGQVSLCSRRTVGWACQAAPDERSALEAEIARLQGENVGLKKALLDKDLPLPGGVKPPPARGDSELRKPGHADLDRMVTAVEKAWRRLVEMMEALQKDMMKKT
jgi:hypothetical protein